MVQPLAAASIPRWALHLLTIAAGWTVLLGAVVPVYAAGPAGVLPLHEHHTPGGFVPRHSHGYTTQGLGTEPSCAEEGNADGLVCTVIDDLSSAASGLLAGTTPAGEAAPTDSLDASLPAQGWHYEAPNAAQQTPPPRG